MVFSMFFMIFDVFVEKRGRRGKEVIRCVIKFDKLIN